MIELTALNDIMIEVGIYSIRMVMPNTQDGSTIQFIDGATMAVKEAPATVRMRVNRVINGTEAHAFRSAEAL